MSKTLKIVFDCCVVSNFALSGSLPVLKRQHGGSAFITDFVSAEIWRGIQAGHANLAGIQEALRHGWLREISLSRAKEKALFQSLSVSLGLGEASSIALAKSRRLLFACDDRAARREAGILGVKLTGTVGILRTAVRKRAIGLKEGDSILAKMIAHGFHSPVRSLKEIA
jgi:predicted nucleic acid-binding protein